VAQHCSLTKAGTKPNQTVTLIGGKGPTYVNGSLVKEGQEVVLKWYDRVAVGSELLLFRHPGVEDSNEEPPSAEMAVEEFSVAAAAAGGSSGGIDEAALASAAKEAEAKHAEELQQLEDEKKAQFEAMEQEFKRQMQEMQEKVTEKQSAVASDSQAVAQVNEQKDAEMEALKEQLVQQKKEMEDRFNQEKITREAAHLDTAAVEADIRELIPKIKELETTCAFLDRGFLGFNVTLQANPKLQVKVKVTNHLTDESITLEKFAFLSAFSVLKDELNSLQQAVLNDREYQFDEANDPVRLMLDNTVDLGSANTFLMGLAYNIGTDDREIPHNIKSLVPPFENIGMLQLRWTPLVSPDDETSIVEDVDDPRDFIGKPWTAKVEIIGAVDLPVKTDLAYVTYTFNGEVFTTPTVSQQTRSPSFEYTMIHHNPNCDANFVNYLENGTIALVVSINPCIQGFGKPPIAASNEVINKNMIAMVENQKATAGGTYANVTVTKTTTGPLQPLSDAEAEQMYKDKISSLEEKLGASEQACKALQARVKALEDEVAGNGGSANRISLEDEARSIFNMIDADKNGSLSPSELSYQLSDLGFPEQEIEALFVRMDVNGDGKVELHEFVKNFAFYQAHIANYAK